ncbi:MAG: phosphoribosylanthranilate isomerase [Cyclobacteriaceae bacterium]
MKIHLKVCGMREQQNLHELVALEPDFIGFIFYPQSPRFVEGYELPKIPDQIKKVGVFVNESEEQILKLVIRYGLNMVQLHGDETIDLANSLRNKGIGVLKVLSVTDKMPHEEIKMFEGSVDYFLFDTKTPKHGGSGMKFDWNILQQYDSKVPFFLSGGIELEDVEKIKALGIDQLFAIDVNSKFEISPGLKDIEKIKALKDQL